MILTCYVKRRLIKPPLTIHNNELKNLTRNFTKPFNDETYSLSFGISRQVATVDGEWCNLLVVVITCCINHHFLVSFTQIKSLKLWLFSCQYIHLGSSVIGQLNVLFYGVQITMVMPVVLIT